jgi:NAD(P)H dehydrogenase (quinone)
MQKVLITGASGVLGRAIVQAAVGTGLAVRQGVRNSSKANPAAETVHLDYADPSTIATALAGVSALVLMAPPLDANAPALLGPVVTAAKAAGVQQIVLISAFGVNHNEQAPMRIVEHLVIDSGIPYASRMRSIWRREMARPVSSR